MELVELESSSSFFLLLLPASRISRVLLTVLVDDVDDDDDELLSNPVVADIVLVADVVVLVPVATITLHADVDDGEQEVEKANDLVTATFKLLLLLLLLWHSVPFNVFDTTPMIVELLLLTELFIWLPPIMWWSW